MIRAAATFAGHLLMLGLVGVIANCSSIPEKWDEGRKGQAPGVKPLRPLGQITATTLSADYATEPQSGAPIAVGLSLWRWNARSDVCAWRSPGIK